MKNFKSLFVFFITLSVVCLFPFSAFAQRASAYVRTGSTGIVRQNPEDEDISFGGAYMLLNAVVTYPNLIVCAKTRFKITEAYSRSDLGTKSVWEKLYVAFSLPVCRNLWIYGGKSLPLYLSGSYFSQLEDYADTARWQKDGAALLFKKDIFSVGAGLISSTSETKFNESFQCGAAVQTDWSKKEIPLEAGVSSIYKSTGDGNGKSVGVRDFSSSIFAQYEFSPAFTMSAGYTINGEPVTANSTYKRVSNYGIDKLENMHIETLTASFKTEKLLIEEETEYGKSFDGDVSSLYSALRVQFPIYGIISMKPAVQYFAVWNGNNSADDRDSLVLYPRFIISKEKHSVSFGAEFEYRETAEDNHEWGWSIPCYYKYTL